MIELDQTERSASEAVARLAGKATRFVAVGLLVTALVCGGGFLLGLAALSGGVRTLWVLLAGCFGGLAIGSAAVALVRVDAIRRQVPTLARELRTLATDGADATRTVFETVASPAPDGGTSVHFAQQLVQFRGDLGSGAARSERLAAAATSIATLPALVLGAVVVTLVFAGLSVLFLIALAL